MPKKMRLTDINVGRFKPRAREYTVWDTRMAGFGVRVRPSGYQSYVYHDNRTGRSTRYTLGPTGLMSLEEARRKCHEVVTEAGPDGIRENTDEERVPLFRDFVAGEWKTARYDRYKPSTRPPTASALNGQLLPVFGALALDRITRTDVTKWFDEYSQSSPGGANWTLALLQRIMNHALGCGHVRSNPARGIKKNPRPKMTRFLSREEICRLHEVLDRCVAQRPSRRQQADIIRLLLLTGCRRGEIVNLQWKEVKADVLNLADAKTGPRRVYLNAQAQGIIERQPRCGSDHVFPSPRAPTRPVSKDVKLWYRVRKEAGIEDVRLHDLRHSHASQAVLQGVPLPVVSKLLGHRHLSMTLRYAHVADQEVEAAAERIGNTIARACGLSIS